MNPEFTSPFLGRIQRPHFCKDAINIGDFCKSFSDEVSKMVKIPQDRNMTMPKILDMPKSAAIEVADICSVDQLTCEGEPTAESNGLQLDAVSHGKTNFPNIVSDLNGGWEDAFNDQAVKLLNSLNVQKQKARVHKRSARKAALFYRNIRYATEVRLEPDVKPRVKYPMVGFSCTEPVVAVRIYQPMKHVLDGEKKLGCRSIFMLTQEVLCLGRNLLTELRDTIRCGNDRLVVSDCHSAASSSRSSAGHVTAKDLYPSGLFCINGVFYVDERSPEAIDYSEPIRQWASERGVPDLPRRVMGDVRFSDLSVRLGYPYVYLHQGRCQHMVVFSDVRLFHPTDVADLGCYPRVVATRREQRQPCGVCGRLNAKWLTTDHQLTPTDPTYYCESCFKDFNYSSDGRPLSKFKAFPIEPEFPADEVDK